MDDTVPATKADLNELRESLRVEISAVRSDLESRFAGLELKLEQITAEANHRYDDLVERMSDGETRLLNAFYAFAQSNQKRMVEMEGNEMALRSRMGTFESRLLEVERRLNIPPAA
jgi:hypothetical protein